MTSLNEFKNDSRVNVYDNTATAQKNWAKSWGLSWWFDLWRYKEYKINNLMYRTGKVFTRHTNYSVTKFYLDNNEISKKEFMDKIKNLIFRPKPIIPIPINKNVSKNEKTVQLSLF